MNETLKTIHSMRSVHGDFNDQAVEEEDLQTILTAAVQAANSSSRQAYSIVAVRDKETMKFFGYTASVI